MPQKCPPTLGAIQNPTVQVPEQLDLALEGGSSYPPRLCGKVWARGLKLLRELRAQVWKQGVDKTSRPTWDRGAGLYGHLGLLLWVP